jgi:hypothetical protein
MEAAVRRFKQFINIMGPVDPRGKKPFRLRSHRAPLKKHADSYSAIVWLDAKTEDALKQSFATTAKRLQNYHPSSEQMRRALESEEINDVVSNIKEWFSAKGNYRWLLVFDNVDNPKLPGVEHPQAYDIESYFPETHQGSILITTRSSRLEIGKVVSIPKLNTRESIKILGSTSGREGLEHGTKHLRQPI